MKLSIQNISKSYRNGKIKALDDFSAELTPGVYGLLGPNGAGKSTLINILVSNLKADSGAVSYNDTEINKLGQHYRDILGYMPQQQMLYDDFTGQRFLWYMAALKGMNKEKARQRINQLLDVVHLKDSANQRLSTYSGGMKQRILIAQALLNDPKVLILDEPTAGVDPKERISIRNFISTIALDKIVVIATHVVTDIEYIAKQVIMIKQGKLVVRDEPASLLTSMINKVFEVRVNDVDQLMELQNSYKISNITNDSQGICARVVSELPPVGVKAQAVEPNLEDLYLFMFD